MDARWAPRLAILAAAVFWTALFGFGAMHPGYAHVTKAVSELGAVGAPHALAWNLIGFIAPGLLHAACGAQLARTLDGRRTALWWMFVAAGVGFAGTGVFPAVVQNGSPLMRAPSTIGHVAAMLVSSVFWLIAVVMLFQRAWRRDDWRSLRLPLVLATLVAFAGLAANLFHDSIPQLMYRPGLGQRLGFAGYFLWYIALSAWIAAPALTARRAARRTPLIQLN